MNYQSISDIYTANAAIHGKLKETLSTLTEAQLSSLPEGEKWTVTQIVEHIAMVQNGGLRICSKLLSTAKAENQMSDGAIRISDNFEERSVEVAAVKLEAPEIVHPSHGKTIGESLAAMDETEHKLNELKPLFEEYDCNTAKYPHPFFGEMSAAEWLMLVGGHEGRHLKQVKNLLAKIG